MNCVSCAEVLSDDQQITQIRLLNDYLTGLTDFLIGYIVANMTIS